MTIELFKSKAVVEMVFLLTIVLSFIYALIQKRNTKRHIRLACEYLSYVKYVFNDKKRLEFSAQAAFCGGFSASLQTYYKRKLKRARSIEAKMSVITKSFDLWQLTLINTTLLMNSSFGEGMFEISNEIISLLIEQIKTSQQKYESLFRKKYVQIGFITLVVAVMNILVAKYLYSMELTIFLNSIFFLGVELFNLFYILSTRLYKNDENARNLAFCSWGLLLYNLNIEDSVCNALDRIIRYAPKEMQLSLRKILGKRNKMTDNNESNRFLALIEDNIGEKIGQIKPQLQGVLVSEIESIHEKNMVRLQQKSALSFAWLPKIYKILCSCGVVCFVLEFACERLKLYII